MVLLSLRRTDLYKELNARIFSDDKGGLSSISPTDWKIYNNTGPQGHHGLSQNT